MNFLSTSICLLALADLALSLFSKVGFYGKFSFKCLMILIGQPGQMTSNCYSCLDVKNCKKSPGQKTVLGNRGRLKVLNDTKLILND